jgi:hypothetical protein
MMVYDSDYDIGFEVAEEAPLSEWERDSVFMCLCGGVSCDVLTVENAMPYLASKYQRILLLPTWGLINFGSCLLDFVS